MLGLLCAFLGEAWGAQIETETVSAKGEGRSRRDAIQAALVEALSKVGGIKMDAESVSQLVATERTQDKKNTFEATDAYESRVRSLTHGLISRWGVEKEMTQGDLVVVELSVTVARILGAGVHESRKTIAVVPFRMEENGSVNGRPIAAAALGRSVKTSLENLITSSRKFALIDNTFSAEVSAVSAQAGALDTMVEAALRRASQLGAEYLVCGSIDSFRVADETERVGTATATFRKVEGTVHVRVVKVDSTQTVLGSTFNLANLELEAEGNRPEQAIMDGLARILAERILDTIYPLKVLAVTGQQEVVIDRGGEGMRNNDRYKVYQAGELLRDRSTGDQSGRLETPVAEIEIIRVLPKVSYARFVGKVVPLEAGSICRRAELTAGSAPARKSPTKASDHLDDFFK